MRGHAQRRGASSWRISVYVGRTADGRLEYVRRTVHGDRAAADAHLRRLVAEVEAWRPLPRSNVALADLLERWLETKGRVVQPKTLDNYRFVAGKNLATHLGSHPIRGITALDVDEFYARLLRPRPDGRGLSRSTVMLCHRVLSQALDQARRWGLVDVNACRDATPPRAARPAFRLLTPDDVRNLIAAAASVAPELGVFVRLVAVTGCRRGEACALRRSDLVLHRREIVIARSISTACGAPVEKTTKTTRLRRVALDDTTALELDAMLTVQDTLARERGIARARDAFVFAASPAGAVPHDPIVMTRQFRAVARKAGVGGVRLHDLRHFAASALLNCGTPVHVVSSRLGHARPSMTLDHYSHCTPPSDHQAARQLAALVDGASSDARPHPTGSPFEGGWLPL
jgi:integrase